MSFESGSASFRMLYVPRALPRDAAERFAAHAAPPLESLGDGGLTGWVGHRHLLDRKITEDNARLGGHLRLNLMKAERKIPESLLRAECRMEELAQMAAQGVERLKQSERTAIRRQVLDRLLPVMPPTLKGIPFLHDAEANLVYAGALSDAQLDAFQVYWARTFGFALIPLGPETAAAARRQVRVREWAGVSFSPEVEDDEAVPRPGPEFFTWLWYVAEARGGMMKLGEAGDFAIAIEGPLLFAAEGGGAHEIVIRKGEPLLGAETKAALLSGKKLRRARLMLVRGEHSWAGTLDAETFVLRGLKLPEGEKLDAISRFQERVILLGIFRDAFLTLYDRFVDERVNAKTWTATLKDMHAWVRGRKTRA